MSTPVTIDQTEAQSFFDRIATTLVAHSQQVRELGEIKFQLNDLSTRVDRLQVENTNLRADLSKAWEAYEQVKSERDTAKAELEIQARDAMAARTETVNVRQDFEQKLGVANDQIHARDERIAQLEDLLAARSREANEWRERSDRWETMAKANEDKLATVQGKLDDIYTMFKPKPAAVQQPWEPDPVAENASQRVINF